MDVKIMDFGFATYNQKRLMSYGGTMSYMAPEIMQHKPYDGQKADIFSLGVILFMSVLGKFPFAKADMNDKFYKNNGKMDDIIQCSTFAHFCLEKFFNQGVKNIVELGSGNGRDAIYLLDMR